MNPLVTFQCKSVLCQVCFYGGKWNIKNTTIPIINNNLCGSQEKECLAHFFFPINHLKKKHLQHKWETNYS